MFTTVFIKSYKPSQFQPDAPPGKSLHKGWSCCLLPMLAFFVFALLGSLIMFYNYVLYENKPEARSFVGGRNESCRAERPFFDFGIVCIEADMDLHAFAKFVMLKKTKVIGDFGVFVPIGEEGIDVTCYKFNSTHPSQKDSFDNSKKNIRFYKHHVAKGFYFSEQFIISEDMDGDPIYCLRLIVYDAQSQRIFYYLGTHRGNKDK